MFMINLKSLWTVVFLSMTILVSAQEICNNALDDDGDMLVDLNDDECVCSDIMPLTSVTGSICRHNLKLTLEVTDATAYQWYKDSIAIIGEIGSTITLSDLLPDVEGTYEVIAITSTGCTISEAYEVEVPFYDVYLGEEYICDGDTIVFGPFFLTREGYFEYRTTASSDGCDSLVSIDVYVTQDAAYQFTETHCEGTCVEFGSQTICTSGIFEESFPSVAGCDSLVRKTFNFVPLEPIMMTPTICAGEVFEFKDISASVQDTYETTCTGISGCDTVYVIELTVIQPVTSTLEDSFCTGGSYEYNGVIYTEAGTTEITFDAVSGCDSIVTLILEMVPPVEATYERSICKGKVFTYGDITATESGSYNTIVEMGLCDSLITINLQVIDPQPAVEDATICAGETFTWNGMEYDTEGTYEFTETTNGECDVVRALNLTVMQEKVENLTVDICSGGSIEMAGMLFDSSGDFEIPLKADSGCDSVLMLTIIEQDAQEYNMEATICQGLSYVFHDIEASASGTYETTVQTDGACDSTFIILLTVETPMAIVSTETICQGKTFEWNGEDYSTAGTYEHMKSVDGACDELYQLDLFVEAPEIISEALELCSSELPFVFGDLKADSTGFYSIVVSEEDECDVQYDFDIKVLEDSESEKVVNICDGDVYSEYGLDITVGGVYYASLTNAAGCDSTITINVLANAVAAPTQETAKICPGDIFVFNGEEITEEGEQTFILQNEFGCDSLVTLSLEYNSLLEFEESHEACEDEPLVIYGEIFTETGIYEIMMSSGSGCDSLIMLDLKVNPNTNMEMDATICEGETFIMDDIIGTETDTYVSILSNNAGCDSIITVNLTVVSHDITEFNMEICQGDVYEYEGQIYDNEGVYPTSFLSSEGCDSIVNLNLAILPLGERVEEVLICPGDEYVYQDIFATEAGTYQTTISNEVGCDSVITIILGVDDIEAALDLGEDKLINIGSSIDIIPEYVSGALNSFEWYDENGDLVGNNQELLSYSPLEDTYVELFAFNDNGCEVRERIDIDVELIVDIYIPNIISAQDEGPNHYFTPGANESVIGIRELYIYDRWGELMFTDDHDGHLGSYLGWDGVFNNEKVIGGVYTYMIIFEIIDGSTIRKAGSFTILD